MEELEGLSVQEEYEIEILLIVSRLIEMEHDQNHPEPLSFNYNHSSEWNKLFEKLYDYTIRIAERLWPNKTVKLVKDEDSKSNLTSDHYPIPSYENMIISTLKAYKSVKDNKEQRFWNYYIKCLKNLIYRHYSNIMIDSRHHLTTRQKSTFRKMLHAWHKVDFKYPNFYSKEVKDYLLEKNLFPNRNELENFYRILGGSLIITLDEGHQAAPKEKSSIFNNATIYESFDFLETCFLKKLNCKNQKTEIQKKNELLYKDLITFYAISNSLKEYPEVSPEKLYSLIFTKKFASRRIIEKYRERDNLLATLIAKDRKNVPIMKKSPVSYEYISSLNNKNLKYASKQMKNFLSFCDTQKNTEETQIKNTEIDKEHLEEEIKSLELHFEKFITKKIQNEDAQKKKIDFCKEIVTLFIAETFLKTYQNLTIETLKVSLENRNFTNTDVLNDLSENKKISYKSISQKHGKQINYGSKVKANFQNS